MKVMELPRVAGNTATAEEVAEFLRTHGAVVIEKLVSEDDMDQLSADLAKANGTFKGATGSFAGAHTTRNAGKPLGESKMAQVLAKHPLVVQAVGLRLNPWCRRFVLGTCSNINVEPPPDINTPPAASQVLHRDEVMWPVAEWPWLPTDDQRPELGISVMWAMSNFSLENGATRMIPGSHRWPRNTGGVSTINNGDDDEEYIDPEYTEDPVELDKLEALCVQATMPKGSVVLWSGATLHGQTAHLPRTDNKDDDFDKEAATRRGLLFLYSVGWLKTEHNWHWAIPHDVIMEMPLSLRELIGMVGGNRVQHPWYTGPVYAQPILGSADASEDEIEAFNTGYDDKDSK